MTDRKLEGPNLGTSGVRKELSHRDTRHLMSSKELAILLILAACVTDLQNEKTGLKRQKERGFVL